MPHYSKIEKIISNDEKFNTLSDDAQLLFFRLLVHPHLTLLGAMRGSMAGYAGELRWEMARFTKALHALTAVDMVRVDDYAHFLWFPNFLKYNAPESPNVVKSWEKALVYLPECPLKQTVIACARAYVGQLPTSFQEALPAVFSAPTTSTKELSEGGEKNQISLREGVIQASGCLQEEGCFGAKPHQASAALQNNGDVLEKEVNLSKSSPAIVAGREGDVLKHSLIASHPSFIKGSEGCSRILVSLREGGAAFQESLPPPLGESVTVTETVAVTETVTEGESREETKKEQDEEDGVLEHIVAPARRGEGEPPPLLAVFDYWKATLGHPQAVLDKKRRAWISQALKSGYSVSQLCQAIQGCSLTPYNMGKNERGQRYDGLHVILRDADQIERFMRHALSPPKERNAAQALVDSNQAVCDAWLQDKLSELGEVAHAIV